MDRPGLKFTSGKGCFEDVDPPSPLIDKLEAGFQFGRDGEWRCCHRFCQPILKCLEVARGYVEARQGIG